MADVVTRLKVESSEYDSKIKRAAQGILQLERTIRNAGEGFQQTWKYEQEFVRSLGQMETVSKDARGQIAELSNAFTNLSMVYNRMSDDEKKSNFGRALSSSLDQLKTRIRDTKTELSGIENSLKGGGFRELIGGISGRFGLSPQMFTGVGAAIAGIGTAAKLAGENIRTAFTFERSMSFMSSLTGKTGEELEQLKEYAIELGSTTTLTASQVADAFRLIGSQQPQLLKSSEALRDVTKAAIRLSEAAGMDLQTASQTLSTSINQFGGDSSNAARFVNVLAAASQKGAGTIAWLGEAITKSGTTANAVGTSYEQLVSVLEILAKAGYDASTAGTALRQIILQLEKQADNNLKPSVVGLTSAFEHLGEKNLSIAEMSKLVNSRFSAQALTLSKNAAECRELEEAITGTNTAEEQAKTNTANLDGSLKALSSAWEGLNLHINDSNGFLKSCVDWLKDTVQWMDNTFTSAGRAKKALDELRGGGTGANGEKINTRTESEVNEVRFAMQGEGDSGRIAQTRILGQYDRDIQQKQKELDDLNKTASTTQGNYFKAIGRIRDEINALQTLKQEFQKASDELISPSVPNPPTQPISDTDNSDTNKPTTKEVTIQQKISELEKEALTASEQRREEIRATIQELDRELAKQKEIVAALHEVPADAVGKAYSDMLRGGRVQMPDEAPQSTARVGIMPGYLTQPVTDAPTALQAAQYEAAKSVKAEDVKVDTSTLQSILRNALQEGIDTATLNLDGVAEQIGRGINVPDETWQGILDEYNALREAIGQDPIEIDFKTGKLKELKENSKGLAGDWQNASSAIQAVGSALGSIEDPAAKVAGIVAQAIATVSLTFASSLKGTVTPWDWIAAAAAGTATMVSTIATIKSSTKGGFAEGGIVPGNSFSGDNLRISDYGINSGELILSRSQQDSIAAQLTGDDGQASGGGIPYVTGETLFLGMSNTLRRQGRGEIVTTSMLRRAGIRL